MKTTLITLLTVLVLNINAQITVKSYKYEEVLCFLLEKYETDCYNDSVKMISFFQNFIGYQTITEGEYNKLKESPFYDIDEYVYDITVKYIHKEPTFADFINWMKTKKYNL